MTYYTATNQTTAMSLTLTAEYFKIAIKQVSFLQSILTFNNLISAFLVDKFRKFPMNLLKTLSASSCQGKFLTNFAVHTRK